MRDAGFDTGRTMGVGFLGNFDQGQPISARRRCVSLAIDAPRQRVTSRVAALRSPSVGCRRTASRRRA
jgi:hypothetical protein